MGCRYEVEKMGHSDRGANEIFLSNVVKKKGIGGNFGVKQSRGNDVKENDR